MIKLYHGEETYLLDKYVEKELDSIEMPEMNITRHFDGYDVVEVERECSTSPFFADTRVVVLRLSELKADEALKKLVSKIPDSTLLIIAADKVDKRSAIFKTLSKSAFACEKPEAGKIYELVCKICSQEGRKAEKDAVSELLARLQYYDDPGINLYAVIGAVRQLAQSGDITVSLVSAMLPENSAGKIWNLLSLVCNRKKEEVFFLLSYLIDSGESGIGIMSVLLKGFRLAWKEGVGVSEGVPRYQYAPATLFTVRSLLAVQEVLERGIELIKSGIDSEIATRVSIVNVMGALENK